MIPKRNVEPKTLTLLVNDLAADEPGNQTEYDPTDNAHAAMAQAFPGAFGSQGAATDVSALCGWADRPW